MQFVHRIFGSTALLLGLGFVAACGRAPEAMAPSPKPETEAAPPPPPSLAPAAAPTLAAEPEPEPEPQTLAEAEALLEKSRAELERLALNEPSPVAEEAPAHPSAPSRAHAPRGATGERAEKSAERASADGAGASPRDKDESGGCEMTCKAFSSLERASQAVCRLDTAGGPRCERARRILDDAKLRVVSCGCSK
jgi:hypothetical protein